MSNSENRNLGIALGAIAAGGVITALAYLISKTRPVNLVVLDDIDDGAGPDVLTHMPAEMFVSQFSIPAGLTLACEKCVVSDRGVTGILTRCDVSGMYQVFNGKAIASIDQDFAISAAEVYPVDAPKEEDAEDDNKEE